MRLTYKNTLYFFRKANYLREMRITAKVSLTS